MSVKETLQKYGVHRLLGRQDLHNLLADLGEPEPEVAVAPPQPLPENSDLGEEEGGEEEPSDEDEEEEEGD